MNVHPCLARCVKGTHLLVLAAWAGCSGTSPATQRVSVPVMLPVEEASLMNRALRFTLSVERVCADAACIGRGYYLSVTNVTEGDTYIQYAPVRLIVGGRTFSWLEENRDETTLRPAIGTFVRVPFSADVMDLLALAPSATLALGSTRIPLSADLLRRLTSVR